MTRSKIQRIKLTVFLLIFLLSQLAVCDGSFRDKRQADPPVPSKDADDTKKTADGAPDLPKDSPKEPRAQNAKVNSAPVNNTKNSGSANLTSKAVSGAATTAMPATPTNNDGIRTPSMDSGAFLRGIFVVAGLSVLVLAYMVFRSFRLNKRPQMVRKYGILAHRQDVEMRPLPLDEDDEDDTTVFDASNISPQRSQSQNS